MIIYAMIVVLLPTLIFLAMSPETEHLFFLALVHTRQTIKQS